MNHPISLHLEHVETSWPISHFRLTMENESSVRLLFPYPSCVHLHFGDKETHQESAWWAAYTQSADWLGLTLNAGERRSLELFVRARAWEYTQSSSINVREDRDAWRWCVDLRASEYLVWYQLSVDEKTYFCGDSHYRWPDLLHEADDRQATLWSGKVMSNRVHYLYNGCPRE